MTDLFEPALVTAVTRARHRTEMVHLHGEVSNSLWAVLTEWDNILKHSSLAWQVPANANDLPKTLPQIDAPVPAMQGLDINLSTHRASLIRKRSLERGNG